MRILKALSAAALLLLIPMSGSATAAPKADVSVSMTVTPQPVVIYWNLTYKIVVQNHGPAVADGVRLKDFYGSDATFIWVSTSEGSCAHTAGGEVTCVLGNMWSGEIAYITLVLKNWGGDGGRNDVTVTSKTLDPKKGNNTASLKTTIIPGPPPPGGTPTGGPSRTPSPSVKPSRSPSPTTATPTATNSPSVIPEASSPIASSSKSGIWIAVGIVALVAGGAAGFMLWRRRR